MIEKVDRALSSSPPDIIGNKFAELGVIVDRSVFDDDDDELTIPTDLPTIVDEDQSYAASHASEGDGARMTRNGKVRRKLRWKPPGFRRNKKKNVSSNQSVISSLTSRSNATNRSTSTTRSFLSHFSRKSQNSFHTFHSMATPVVKNNRKTQHTFQRPNYCDAFDADMSGPSTISNEGWQAQTKAKSRNPARGVDVAGPASTINGVSFYEPFGEGGSVFTPAVHAELHRLPTSSKRRERRPPLFKRISQLGKSKSMPTVLPRDSKTSVDNKNSAGSTVVSSILSKESDLKESIPLERQVSNLPALECDDFQDPRRLTPWERTGISLEKIDEGNDGNKIGLNHSVETTSTTASAFSNGSGSGDGSSTGSPMRKPQPTPPRRYNRPVDSTIIEGSQSSESEERKSRRSSVPVDLDEAAYVEADHNLKAIHDMAREHLVHGEYEEAIEVFEEILRGQEARFGGNSRRVGTALHNLGLVHMKSRNYEKALSICKRATDVRKTALGEKHPDVAISLVQLGLVHLELEEFNSALAVLNEALSIRTNDLGPRHLKAAKIMNNIGCCLFAMDRLDEALQTFEKARDIQRGSLNTLNKSGDAEDEVSKVPDSITILLGLSSTLCNIGSVKSKQGRYDEAEQALEEALLIQESVLREGHPAILATLECIDFVADNRETTMNPARALMSRLSRPRRLRAALSCEPNLDDVLNYDDIGTALTPQTWFEHVGDIIAERTGCTGPGYHEVGVEAVLQEQETTLVSTGI